MSTPVTTERYRAESLKFGDVEITGFVEAKFRLDGGAMFGVIPRVMWEKMAPPDNLNRVAMRTNLFLVKSGPYRILLDTGLGDALSERDHKIYGVEGGGTQITVALDRIGVRPDDVTHVILTHLHTDHANGAVAGDPDRPVLRYPNAEFVVQRDEWDDAMNPNERTGAVYMPHRLQPIEDSGRLNLVEGDVEVVPGVRVKKTGGHTRGHQGVEVTSAGNRFIYYADIIPSRFHLKTPYVAAVDLFPLDTMKVKRALVADCCESAATIVGFDHDIDVLFGRIVKREKWLDVVPAETTVIP